MKTYAGTVTNEIAFKAMRSVIEHTVLAGHARLAEFFRSDLNMPPRGEVVIEPGKALVLVGGRGSLEEDMKPFQHVRIGSDDGQHLEIRVGRGAGKARSVLRALQVAFSPRVRSALGGARQREVLQANAQLTAKTFTGIEVYRYAERLAHGRAEDGMLWPANRAHVTVANLLACLKHVAD